MLKNFFKSAWKNIIRNKAYSAINVLGLSIGLTCCMLIILYNRDEVSFDRFHKDADAIYRVTAVNIQPDGKVANAMGGSTGMMPGPTFKEAIPEVVDFMRVQSEQLPVQVGTEIFDQEALYVDSNFFSFFSFPLLSGPRHGVFKDPNSVVISERVAEKLFGTADAVGKILYIPGPRSEDEHHPQPNSRSLTVTGVVPNSPQNSSIKIQMLIPMQANTNPDNQWMNFFLNTFLKLAPGTNPQKVEEKFKHVYARAAATQILEDKTRFNNNNTINYSLQPFLAMHLSTEFPAGNGLSDASNPLYSKILGSIALFILLIASINFVNLSMARSIKRAKEIGVRKVIGGARNQLIFQFLGEAFLMSLIAFSLALVLVISVLPLFNLLANKALSFSYLLDTKLIIGFVTLLLVTTLLAGFYPALVLSRFNPVQSLYNRLPLSRKNYLSKGLIVLQFALTTFLIIATITIYSQFNYLQKFDLGYNDKNLVVINTDRMLAGDVAVFRNQLAQNPSIQSVAVRQRGQWSTIAKVDGNEMDFSMDVVDSSFLSTLNVPLVAGRNFSSAFPSDSLHSILVNESFMKKAGWKDLRNREVDFFYDSIKYTVIGVVRDYHFNSLLRPIVPQLFTMNPKYGFGKLLIRINPTNTASTLAFIQQVFKKQQPSIPYKYDFQQSINEEQYRAEGKWKQIISFAAVITIFISCIGLFGLATLAAEKRTKEIGIRKVLGASVRKIASSLTGNFLLLVMISTLFAFPAAWYVMSRWLQNYPYRIHLGAWIFAVAAIAVSMIAIATVSIQAIRAAMANPIKSLRTE